MTNMKILGATVALMLAACGGGAATGDVKNPGGEGEKKDGYGYEFKDEKVSPGMTAAPETKAAEKPIPGRLAPEEIQKVVRADFGKMKVCYEELLKADAKAAGKLAVRFEIKADGAPDKVSKDSATITDEKMVQCVLDVFKGLKYPAPEGGIVTVVYPIEFSP